MDLTLVRNATLLLDRGGRRLIVDPMLDPPGARTTPGVGSRMRIPADGETLRF